MEDWAIVRASLPSGLRGRERNDMGDAIRKQSVETLSGLNLPIEQAEYCRDMIVPLMTSLRKSVDSLEVICDKKVWPYPSTGALIFSVK